jgi:hypothetical protein
MAKNGDTGSLGWQDSNLEMLFRKMPFEMSREFLLISEHIVTADFSRVCCRDGEKQPAGAGLLAPVV